MLTNKCLKCVIVSIVSIDSAKFTGADRCFSLDKAGSEEESQYAVSGVIRYSRQPSRGGRRVRKGGSVQNVYSKCGSTNLVARDVHWISAYSPAARRRMRRGRLISFCVEVQLCIIRIITIMAKSFFRTIVNGYLIMSVQYSAGSDNVQLVSFGICERGGLVVMYVVVIALLSRCCVLSAIKAGRDYSINSTESYTVKKTAWAPTYKGRCHEGGRGKYQNEFY